jgi:hypothetical protein
MYKMDLRLTTTVYLKFTQNIVLYCFTVDWNIRKVKFKYVYKDG